MGTHRWKRQWFSWDWICLECEETSETYLEPDTRGCTGRDEGVDE